MAKLCTHMHAAFKLPLAFPIPSLLCWVFGWLLYRLVSCSSQCSTALHLHKQQQAHATKKLNKEIALITNKTNNSEEYMENTTQQKRDRRQHTTQSKF